MNRKIIVLTAAFLMSISVMFAQEVKTVPPFIVKAMQAEFKDAVNVQWKMVDPFYKVILTVDETELEAFYSAEGKLTAVSRKLTIDQLPLALMKEVKEKAKTHTISDLFELLTDKGTEYFLSITNEKETKTFRSDGQDWERY